CVLQLRFGEALRNLSGEQFVRLLSDDIKAPVVVIGHDFKFGRHGVANATLLAEAGLKLGFAVDVVPPVAIDGVRVSSSEIRGALERGDLDTAARWLGCPTANLRLDRKRSALYGIFAVRVRGIPGLERAPGVASLGTRPTVGGTVPLLEVYVFDFDGDLYGREIEVEFVAKLREEQRFASVDAMVEQMHRDAAEARRILEA